MHNTVHTTQYSRYNTTQQRTQHSTHNTTNITVHTTQQVQHNTVATVSVQGSYYYTANTSELPALSPSIILCPGASPKPHLSGLGAGGG